jgi:hypothetical protein
MVLFKNKKDRSRGLCTSTQGVLDPLLLSIFDFSSVHRMLPRFPFLAQPAHGFSQAHRQRRNRFQPVFAPMRERPVILAVNLSEQQLRVSQNSGQRGP